jgi:hypothetical protein
MQGPSPVLIGGTGQVDQVLVKGSKTSGLYSSIKYSLLWSNSVQIQYCDLKTVQVTIFYPTLISKEDC